VWVPDFLTFLQMSGMVFGNFSASMASDWSVNNFQLNWLSTTLKIFQFQQSNILFRYGRRKVFLIVILSMWGSTVVSAIAPNPYVYGVARFLAGAGFAG